MKKFHIGFLTFAVLALAAGMGRSQSGDLSSWKVLAEGGALDSTPPHIGLGHSGIVVDTGTNWFSCHYESAADPSMTNGVAEAGGPRRGSPLAVMPFCCTADNWPEVDLKPAN